MIYVTGPLGTLHGYRSGRCTSNCGRLGADQLTQVTVADAAVLLALDKSALCKLCFGHTIPPEIRERMRDG